MDQGKLMVLLGVRVQAAGVEQKTSFSHKKATKDAKKRNSNHCGRPNFKLESLKPVTKSLFCAFCFFAANPHCFLQVTYAG